MKYIELQAIQHNRYLIQKQFLTFYSYRRLEVQIHFIREQCPNKIILS